MNSTKYTLRYLPSFEKDLEGILLYIAKNLENPHAASRLLSKIETAIKQRALHPLSFEAFPSTKQRKHPYYRIYVDNYTIFYVVIDTTIEIRRILYSRQNLSSIISQEN